MVSRSTTGVVNTIQTQKLRKSIVALQPKRTSFQLTHPTVPDSFVKLWRKLGGDTGLRYGGVQVRHQGNGNQRLGWANTFTNRPIFLVLPLTVDRLVSYGPEALGFCVVIYAHGHTN